ncbi:helix-turn-helix transcriptional regulator [Corynebacterium gallinarum]|uniref:Helix-turn-helix transcriptional regulator n=1 Tax=Corynebacterium gallinarum TaxID=2762214 RepID=A0A8I0HNS8_9CORY|nr:helix-turn-helix transcriptional regulator [Corynebacterium gallinarum]MBD8030807.1 helix-turn-helix transcriptional regulator [Corynebacterium gallinarum]
MGNIEAMKGQIAERVKRARKNKQLTQPELSEALAEEGIFISPSAIAKIENNKRGIELTEAAAIAKILGLGLDLLVKPDEDNEEYRGSQLQEQAFASGLTVVGNFHHTITAIDNHLEIVAERVKLSTGNAYCVPLEAAQRAQMMAEKVVSLLNEASNAWREVLVHGGTLKESVLEKGPSTSGYGGDWSIPSLESRLDDENGKG